MKIVFERPPLFREIDRVFKVRGQPVIFSWGDRIYNPERITITPELKAHEEVHGRHQGDEAGVIAWWRRYLVDKQFRLEEELPAHRAEYFRFCARHSNRNRRADYLSAVASRLASTLYGGLIAPADAQRAILRGWL